MRSVVWTVAAVVASLAVGCKETSPEPPSTAAKSVASVVMQPASGSIAGSVSSPAARVFDANGAPLEGVAVTWLPTAFGQPDSAVTHTLANGVARARWTTTTVPGTYGIRAKAREITSAEERYEVGPGAPAGVQLGRDTVRFTRLRQIVRIASRVVDRFGNPTGPKLNLSISGPFTASQVGDTLELTYTGSTSPAQGSVTITLGFPAQPAGRVALVLDAPVASVELAGGLDSIRGIGVGESQTFRVAAYDSSRYPFVLSDVSQLGVVFTSSDPSVASVDANGVVRGLRPGTPIITARHVTSTRSMRVPIVETRNLGAKSTLYSLPHYDLYFRVSGASLDSLGGSWYTTEGFFRPSGSGGVTTVAAHDADGTRRWTRGFPLGTNVNGGQDGRIYVAEANPPQLHRFDPSGREEWTQPFFGLPTPSAAGVLLSTDTLLRSFTNEGTLAWTTVFTDSVRVVRPAPARVYVETSQRLWALDSRGSKLWSRSSLQYPPAVIDETSMYFTSTGSSVVAIDSSGVVRWSRAVESAVHLRVAGNEMLLAMGAGKLVAYDRRTGDLRWSVGTPFNGGLPSVSGNTVYVMSDYLYVYDLSTGQPRGRTVMKFPGGLGVVCAPSGLIISGLETVDRLERCF